MKPDCIFFVVHMQTLMNVLTHELVDLIKSVPTQLDHTNVNVSLAINLILEDLLTLILTTTVLVNFY